jgi:hypothetical protein
MTDQAHPIVMDVVAAQRYLEFQAAADHYRLWTQARLPRNMPVPEERQVVLLAG